VPSGLDVAHWNRVFSRYPMTVEDKGWVYGVWYCGTAWQRVKLYGEYPQGFLARALALFPRAKDVLHCPSGTVTGPGVTVDMHQDAVRCPQIVAFADALPFEDNSFDLYLSDPPYSREDSAKYGCPPYPMKGAMREARRVLRRGGYFGMLHTYMPTHRRQEFRLVGLIAVVLGVQRATRMFSIFQVLK